MAGQDPLCLQEGLEDLRRADGIHRAGVEETDDAVSDALEVKAAAHLPP
jgi:hypothetical protein